MDYDVIYENLKYRAPKEGQSALCQSIHDNANQFAMCLRESVPEGHDKQQAFEKLTEAVMWAYSGIARG
jgi:hypothetical protein